MYQHFHNKFQKTVFIIHPGEYLASGDDIIISTVLGSCVAVALYDPTRRSGGLNHFMLPGSIERHNFMNETGKYGVFAMELLLNSLLREGSRKSSIRAKVFGGGHVLASAVQGSGSVPRSNVEFAIDYLQTEGIPIESQDVGGTTARKVFFFPQTARVLLKRITGQLVKDVEKEEEEYLKSIRSRKKDTGDVTLF